MTAYIRKFNDRYYVFAGEPKNHASNAILDENGHNTRRVAERFIKKNGYTLTKRTSGALTVEI